MQYTSFPNTLMHFTELSPKGASCCPLQIIGTCDNDASANFSRVFLSSCVAFDEEGETFTWLKMFPKWLTRRAGTCQCPVRVVLLSQLCPRLSRSAAACLHTRAVPLRVLCDATIAALSHAASLECVWEAECSPTRSYCKESDM